MNAPPAQPDLNTWLELATRGLPHEARQRVCEEIEDHYWNSASYYEEQGKASAEAHRDAIAELGDVRKARGAFLDAHASKLRYLLAGLLSMAMPLLFAAIFLDEPEHLVMGGPFRTALIGLVYLFQPLVLGLPMTAIVFAGYSLLSYRFHFPIGKWRAGLPLAGVLIVFVPSAIDGTWLLLTGSEFFDGAGLFRGVSLHGMISDTGVFMLSLGLLAMGHHISKLKHSLYGTKFMLVTSSLVWGLCQIGLIFVGTVVSPLVFVLLFTATAFCIFLGWMFIKAAFMGRLFDFHRLGRTGTAA